MNPRKKGSVKVFNSLCRSLALIPGFLPSTAAWAQDSDSFRWSVTPYLWATQTKVDLTLRDEALGGGQIAFKDLLDVLDSAFMVHVEGGVGTGAASWT